MQGCGWQLEQDVARSTRLPQRARHRECGRATELRHVNACYDDALGADATTTGANGSVATNATPAATGRFTAD